MNLKRIIIFAVSILLISYGIFTAEHLQVMRKATTICLECIGIG